MQIQLIRSATLRVEYTSQRFLIDPCLAAKHTRPSYAGISPNPLVDLPCSPEEMFAGVERVILSHLHSDHFDPAAEAWMPKAMPILCQPCDAQVLRDKGFVDVTPVNDQLRWDGVTITRTPCQHGSGAVLREMGEASGFVLRAQDEPTLYWAGDTVWCDAVSETLAREQPDVAVVHASGAMWGEGILIVMDAEQVARVCRIVPTVIATHLEAYDHGTVTRATLRAHAESKGISAEQLLIPGDGQTIRIS
jgi:L-ascorbate metabolism protein UlaG (beta-lactamase superfamily)